MAKVFDAILHLVSPSASRHLAEGFEGHADPTSSVLEIVVWQCVTHRLQLLQLLSHRSKTPLVPPPKIHVKFPVRCMLPQIKKGNMEFVM